MKETGRYYIRSFKTGRLYLVEPIRKRSQGRTDFGESLLGGHGSLCEASITEDQSIIKPENGFTNIGYSKNPLDYIERLENEANQATRKDSD